MRFAILIVRWLARLSSVLSIGLLILFLKDFNPAVVRPREWIGLAFFPVGVILGLGIAWWKEALGGAIALLSVAAFYLIYGWLLRGNVGTVAFLVFASPAFLFLIAWLLSRTRGAERKEATAG
jgi:hypothetical protein